MENLDNDAINAMKVGGERFCDEAIKKWTGNYYEEMSQKFRLEMTERWSKIRNRIGELCNELSRNS